MVWGLAKTVARLSFTLAGEGVHDETKDRPSGPPFVGYFFEIA